MATQNSGHPPVHFSISTPFRHVRLIEVPDDLLAILTSSSTSTSQPPPRLKFKSAVATTSATSTQGSDPSKGQNLKEPIMHLCTNDKAWAVKQVSTSNSVYLIQPTHPPAEVNDNETEDPIRTAAQGAVTAIAQVGNFLELHPVKTSDRAVEESITSLLPIHHPRLEAQHTNEDMDIDRDLDFQRTNQTKQPVSLDQLIDNLATPDDIVRDTCAKLSVFEHPTSQNCLIPSTHAILSTWTTLTESCAIENIKLDGQPLPVTQILNALAPSTPDSTLAFTLLNPTGTFHALGLFNDEANPKPSLNPTRTSRFVAGLLLTCAPAMTMPMPELLGKWTDLVPASWVKYCAPQLLSDPDAEGGASPFEVSSGDGGDLVSWRGRVLDRRAGVVLANMLVEAAGVAGSVVAAGGADAGGDGPVKSAGPAADKKRMWHERFGAQRSRK